jgi:LAGLIDADG DNA endonuclease family
MNDEKFDLYLIERKNLVASFILGDGHLNPRGCLTIEHGIKQKEYLFWKYHLLRELSTLSEKSFPIFTSRIDSRTNLSTFSYRFNTRNLFVDLRDKFYERFNDDYKHPKKIFPFYLKREITSAMIAIWFMDDGGIGGNTKLGLVIDISNFSFECRNLIKETFWEKFGIETSFHNGTSSRGNSTCKLYFMRGTIEKFYFLISPYIIESMRYKLVKLDLFFKTP